jgi:hypothetical protein
MNCCCCKSVEGKNNKSNDIQNSNGIWFSTLKLLVNGNENEMRAKQLFTK